ncbi:MAG TPA: AsmA family protein [Tepidisphaeraceae bacterium]|jgi:hypothetical protein
MSVKPRHSSRRPWVYIAGAIAALIVIVLLIAGSIIAHIAKNKLQALVQNRLNARLEVGSCSYVFPYGLILHKASLIARDPAGSEWPLASVDRLEIKLAELPKNDRTLRIEKLVLQHPAVHLNNASGQEVDWGQLIKQSQGSNANPATQPIQSDQSDHSDQPAQPVPKTSDAIRLATLEVSGGEIIYNDESIGDVAIKAKSDAKNPAQYTYSLTAGAAALGAKADGTLDIDQWLLHARHNHLAIDLDSQHPLKLLPKPIERQLAAARAEGKGEIDASADIPLKIPKHATFTMQVHIARARADNPDWPAPLDNFTATANLSRDNASAPVAMKVSTFRAASGPATLQILGGNFVADINQGTWSATELNGVIYGEQATTTAPAGRPSRIAALSNRYTILGRVDFTAAANGAWGKDKRNQRPTFKILAYARDASFVIPHAEAAIDRINGGPLTFTDQLSSIKNLSAHYGYDVLQISNATLQLNDTDHGRGVTGLEADIKFDHNSPRYPQPVGKYVDILHPQGEFQVTGGCLVYPKTRQPRYSCDLTASSPDVSFALGDSLFPLDHANIQVIAKADTINLKKFQAQSSGGKVIAKAQIKLSQPITMNADATFENIDVRQAYATIASHGGQKKIQINQKISGHASGDVHVANTGTDWHTATANGNVEITGGDFGSVPIVTQLADAAHLSSVGLTSSEAAAVFDVNQQKIHFSNIAVSAPAIGIQGDGNIAFDGDTHLHVVVAPLSDWRQKLNATKIPLVGDLAGAAQTLLNQATRLLLYEFHVTGNIRDPKVEPVPVPILTKKTGKLFARMLQTKPEQDLLETLRIKPENK